MNSAAQLFELGGAKLAQGDFAGAIEAYQQCRLLEPRSAALYNNLGTALLKAGRVDHAIATLEVALALDPKYARPRVNLGKALIEAGRAAEALAPLREILKTQPDYVPALVNLGDALTRTGDIEQAHAVLDRAVALDPNSAEARISLADAKLQAGHLDSAIEEIRQVLRFAPEHVNAHWHLGHLSYMAGRWRDAWPHLDYRLKRQELSLSPNVRRWDVGVQPERPVRLVGEQGLGDQIQFARYAPIMASAGVACVLQCDDRLVTLFTEARLGVPIEALTAATAADDVLCFPLLSAPLWHGTTPQTVPLASGYLKSNATRIKSWRERLPGGGRGRIGLAWAGNTRYEVGRHAGRSPPFSALAALARHNDITFISLQKGNAGEILAAGAHPWITRLNNFDDGPDAFLDTAAILSSIDLLITSDTSIAHLAGALGVPTWLCLMRIPDWRWSLAGCDTPWYDSMRLFRQKRAGDWDAVYGDVADELARWRV